MAKEKPRCVLCGQEIGWMDRSNISIWDTDQPACSDCRVKYDKATEEERSAMERQILDSPYLTDLAGIEDYRQSVAGKVCSACHSPLERKLKDFLIGSDGHGGLSSMGLEQYMVDLYQCPACGKVELYTAASRSKARQVEESQVTCPVCGTEHSSLIGCPRCALDRAGRTPSAPSPKATGPKPPWER